MVWLSTFELTRLVSEFANHSHELRLDSPAVQRGNTHIETIKAQHRDDPNPTIVQQSGRKLRSVTEGAIGSLLVSALAADRTAWARGDHDKVIFLISRPQIHVPCALSISSICFATEIGSTRKVSLSASKSKVHL
jgi:hypothetical protein